VTGSPLSYVGVRCGDALTWCAWDLGALTGCRAACKFRQPSFRALMLAMNVRVPVGRLVQVANIGDADADAFTAGLYVSRRVDATTRACDLDPNFPLRDAVQVASVSFPSGLRRGETKPIVFPRTNTIESWMASQWNSDRNAMHRCLFVYVDDTQTNFELQPTEVDNIASVPVKLLDPVDLEPSAFQVSFERAPWLSGRIINRGIVTVERFFVDFYQVCLALRLSRAVCAGVRVALWVCSRAAHRAGCATLRCARRWMRTPLRKHVRRCTTTSFR
jgi:hypothetical protein